ncbi:MAG: DUF3995 domain-containing protein [Pseudomonadota bacterium]
MKGGAGGKAVERGNLSAMNLLACCLALVLAGIGLIHMAWAAGSNWPCASEQSLARTVVGSRNIERMPPRFASFVVALCLIGAAAWALALRDLVPVRIPRELLALGGAALVFVFGMRGLLGILPAFERVAPEQPFVRLNRLYYSPLCILIAIVFALLVLALPNWTWRLGL